MIRQGRGPVGNLLDTSGKRLLDTVRVRELRKRSRELGNKPVDVGARFLEALLHRLQRAISGLEAHCRRSHCGAERLELTHEVLDPVARSRDAVVEETRGLVACLLRRFETPGEVIELVADLQDALLEDSCCLRVGPLERACSRGERRED